LDPLGNLADPKNHWAQIRIVRARNGRNSGTTTDKYGGPGVHHTLGSDHHASVNVKGIAQSSAQEGYSGISAENGFKIHEGSNLPDPRYQYCCLIQLPSPDDGAAQLEVPIVDAVVRTYQAFRIMRCRRLSSVSRRVGEVQAVAPIRRIGQLLNEFYGFFPRYCYHGLGCDKII